MPDEYGYKCLPLCVLDAVWSIGVRYSGVLSVVSRYCARYGLDSSGRNIRSAGEHGVDDLIVNIESVGPERFSGEVVCNRQRTSTTAGILKAEAVLRFARVLARHGVRHLSDLPSFGQNVKMDCDIRMIPGQTSGKSLKYFYMLAGDESLTKPDRMTLGFLTETTGTEVDDNSAQALIAGACEKLIADHPALTTRALDHKIWRYQSGRGNA